MVLLKENLEAVRSSRHFVDMLKKLVGVLWPHLFDEICRPRPSRGLLDQKQRLTDSEDLWPLSADLCGKLSTESAASLPRKVSLITNFKEHLRDEIGVRSSEMVLFG